MYMHFYAQGTWLFQDTGNLGFQLIGYQILELLARYASMIKYHIYQCIICYLHSVMMTKFFQHDFYANDSER